MLASQAVRLDHNPEPYRVFVNNNGRSQKILKVAHGIREGKNEEKDSLLWPESACDCFRESYIATGEPPGWPAGGGQPSTSTIQLNPWPKWWDGITGENCTQRQAARMCTNKHSRAETRALSPRTCLRLYLEYGHSLTCTHTHTFALCLRSNKGYLQDCNTRRIARREEREGN